MSYLQIKELLKERGMTAKDLAEHLGISENGISMIINGRRQPRFEVLEKIANYLGVELWQLFVGSRRALNGFVDYNGATYRIQTKMDLESLLRQID